MFATTKENQGSRYGSEVDGKSVLISFPAHEAHLLQDLDRLAHADMTSRSQYVRRLVRRAKRDAIAEKKQAESVWTNLYGDN